MEAFEDLGGTSQGEATARDDAFLNRGAIVCIASPTRSLGSLPQP